MKNIKEKIKKIILEMNNEAIEVHKSWSGWTNYEASDTLSYYADKLEEIIK